MTLRVDRSKVTPSEAIALDDACDSAAQRRARNQAAGRCINENKAGTHGAATHGVRCRVCYAKHRGVSIHDADMPSRVFKHGKSWSPTWRSWNAMIRRCTNPSNTSWKYYGGRGVRVCDRWLGPNGFKNFLADMGERPEGMTIDRFPNRHGNYEPGNCRWATHAQQMRNSCICTISDEDINRARDMKAAGKTMAEIADALGIDRSWASRLTRGIAAPARTHCKAGHAITPDSVYSFTRGNGQVVTTCRECKRIRDAQRSAA